MVLHPKENPFLFIVLSTHPRLAWNAVRGIYNLVVISIAFHWIAPAATAKPPHLSLRTNSQTLFPTSGCRPLHGAVNFFRVATPSKVWVHCFHQRITPALSMSKCSAALWLLFPSTNSIPVCLNFSLYEVSFGLMLILSQISRTRQTKEKWFLRKTRQA